MSLIVASTQNRVGFLLTDGATYNADASIYALRSKVLQLPRLSCAISYEGFLSLCEVSGIITELGISTQRELIQRLGEVVYHLRDWTYRWRPEHREADILLCAVVYAAEVGASVWCAHSGGNLHRPGMVPFEPKRAVQYCNAGDPADLLARPTDLTDARSFAFTTDGIALAEAARACVWNDDDAGHYVGGFLELTTVGSFGVRRKQLCRWPDQVGKPVDPAQVHIKRWFNPRR